MRLKSDEQQVLAAIAGGRSYENVAGVDRLDSILRKFQSHGFVASGDITSRGLHVASTIELPQEQEPDGTIHGQPESSLADQIDGTSVTEGQGFDAGGTVESGNGPDVKAAERPSDSTDGGLSAVPKPSRKSRHKP
jgi:hypothetical protein